MNGEVAFCTQPHRTEQHLADRNQSKCQDKLIATRKLHIFRGCKQRKIAALEYCGQYIRTMRDDAVADTSFESHDENPFSHLDFAAGTR